MPAAVLGVAALAGGVASYKGAKKSAQAVSNAAGQSTALSKEQFERGIQEVAPFREIGIGALGNLGEAANQDFQPFGFRDPSTFLDDYFSNPNGEYAALEREAQDQILRGASVTGGLRSGASNVNLAKIAPTLGLNALDRINQRDLQAYGINQSAIGDRFNRLYGVANLGANVASGNQNAGMNFASTAGQNALAAGVARGNSYAQGANAISGLASDLGTAYLGNRMGYFNQANGAKI